MIALFRRSDKHLPGPHLRIAPPVIGSGDNIGWKARGWLLCRKAGSHPGNVDIQMLDVEKVAVTLAIVVMLESVGLVIVHELLDDRIPYEWTAEFTGNDTDVAHCA